LKCARLVGRGHHKAKKKNKNKIRTAPQLSMATRMRRSFNSITISFLLLIALVTVELITRRAVAQEKDTNPPLGQPPEIQVVQTKEVMVITLAGVGPQDKDGKLVAPGDFAAQFKQTWDNLRRLLASAGAPLRNIASINVYTTEAKWQDTFTALQQESFKDWRPATSFAVVQQLRTPGALLEVHAVAVIENRKPIRR
jgi:enamine deaminase RidA (YjgF/YER057c/UK114 family)